MDQAREVIVEKCHFIEMDPDVIIARSSAERMAERAGFSKLHCSEISIAASELANNIVKHAGVGMLVLRIWENPGITFEIIAEDRGQGISNIDMAIKDFHTEEGPIVTSEGRMRPIAEGMGCGLSAVQRLMGEVRIWSRPGNGTIVRAVKEIKL